jgi:hypothetical protein
MAHKNKRVGDAGLVGNEAVFAVAGMAGPIGRGPAGKCCFDCLNAVDKMTQRGGPALCRCAAYPRIMGGMRGPRFEIRNAACPYFELAPTTRITSRDFVR